MAKIKVDNTDKLNSLPLKWSNLTTLETPSNSRGMSPPDCHSADAGTGKELRKKSVEIVYYLS